MPHNERHPNAQDTSDAQQRAADAEARSLISPSAMHGVTDPEAFTAVSATEVHNFLRAPSPLLNRDNEHRTRTNQRPEQG